MKREKCKSPNLDNRHEIKRTDPGGVCGTRAKDLTFLSSVPEAEEKEGEAEKL